MQNYLINVLVNFFFYISISVAIRYVILRKPIKNKWVAIGILVPIFIGFSILINIQRNEEQKNIYQELNMPYKSRSHMFGSPILYVAMAFSYGILRRRNKKSEAMKPHTKADAASVEEAGKKAADPLPEEIKKRGLSQENKPQETSIYEGSSFTKNKEAGRISKWVYAISIIAIVIALAVIIFSDKEQVVQKEAAVTEPAYLLKETQEAAEQGNSKAQAKLGSIYYNGEGVTQDYKESVKWFTRAAEQRDTWAQFVLGIMYYNGEGVTQDYKESVKWFTKAAEQGDMVAQSQLGVMYDDGIGVTQDYKEAIKWYTKAAEQGDTTGQVPLGWMNETGKGVLQNFVEAYKWYNLAAARGDENARRSRDRLIKIMTHDQIAMAQQLSREFTPKKQK